MRMRYKPYARPELAAWPYYIDKPEEWKRKWRDVFPNPSASICLELGCGKGGFIAQLALRDSDLNFLGVDIKSEVLVVAKRNIEQAYQEEKRPIKNIAIMSWDIEKISSILAPEDKINRIYINFCNPWYKSGHAKHRLTHPRQLIQYREFLVENGEIWFKTDNDPLFQDSLRYFSYAGFEVTWKTENLHADEPKWNIRTEHEKMFSDEGISIKACIAKMVPAKLDKAIISCMKDI